MKVFALKSRNDDSGAAGLIAVHRRTRPSDRKRHKVLGVLLIIVVTEGETTATLTEVADDLRNFGHARYGHYNKEEQDQAAAGIAWRGPVRGRKGVGADRRAQDLRENRRGLKKIRHLVTANRPSFKI